jgi:hypothetical protein
VSYYFVECLCNIVQCDDVDDDFLCIADDAWLRLCVHVDWAVNVPFKAYNIYSTTGVWISHTCME